MCRWEPSASSSSSARALWHRISTFGGLRGAQDAKKTRSRALSAGQYHPMGLYAHICTYKCAAGSPTSAAAAEREHLCTELALFAGCGAHKKPKTRSRALSAGQSHHVGLNAHICTSKCAAGPPRSPEPSRAPVAEQRPLLSPLPLPGLNGDGNRERTAERPHRSTAQAGCLGVLDAYQCPARPQPSRALPSGDLLYRHSPIALRKVKSRKMDSSSFNTNELWVPVLGQITW